MDTMAAFMMGMANRGKEQMVFDWDKAAELIRERKPRWAEAGLKGDFENTGGLIYDEGHPVTDDYTYLASTWATPILQLGHYDEDEVENIPCYKMQHEVPAWNSGTKWPQSAIDILEKEEVNASID